MNKARITLKHPEIGMVIAVGPHVFDPGAILEVSYEDCLGAMLPKFYYPAEPTELEIRSPYGRPAGTKREPSYQVPADAIESVEVDEDVARGWEGLIAKRGAETLREELANSWCHCGHSRLEHERTSAERCMFEGCCAGFDPDFFGGPEELTLAEAVEKVKADDTVSFHAVTNGTSATLDAIAAAELAEIYARGSR